MTSSGVGSQGRPCGSWSCLGAELAQESWRKGLGGPTVRGLELGGPGLGKTSRIEPLSCLFPLTVFHLQLLALLSDGLAYKLLEV